MSENLTTWPAGTILLAATPIGNTGDASERLRSALTQWGDQDGDVIAAEDTRRLRALAGRLEIPVRAKLVSYHDHNETARAAELVAQAQAGARILVVSDAGMPAVSDPGYRIVAAAQAAGVPVSGLPGPSAMLLALALSGLPSDRFAFEGFVPRKSGQRTTLFTELATQMRTLIFFESPHRLADTLTDMASVFGPTRPAAVCRELTKTYEEVRRATLAELADWASDGVRGEICIVVGPYEATAGSVADLVAEVEQRVAGGQRRKDACRELAAIHGVSSRELYEAAVSALES